MNDLIKLFLIVGGVFVLGAHPEAIGNILGGILRDVFSLLACFAGELHQAAGGGLVVLAAIFGLIVMFRGVASGNGGGKGGGKKK